MKSKRLSPSGQNYTEDIATLSFRPMMFSRLVEDPR